MTRKMASIRTISDIRPIENADAIEVAVVDGWQVVVKKGEYQIGDKAVYCEIDSWIPHELAPFLSKGKEPREYEGVLGERVRTVKLRGQISQGLLLPLVHLLMDGLDVSSHLNIQKWEAPIPAQLAGEIRGFFPTEIPKTDQERIQNLVSVVDSIRGLSYEVTEKLEGTSCTFYLDPEGDFHVCSRNLDLKRNDDNTMWSVAVALNIEHEMKQLKYFGVAIQGELIGPGIQNNIYKLKNHQFACFDMYDVTKGRYLSAPERVQLCNSLGIDQVPTIAEVHVLHESVDEILKMADGVSQLYDTPREGIVFKCISDPSVSFKAISNNYLLREK